MSHRVNMNDKRVSNLLTKYIDPSPMNTTRNTKVIEASGIVKLSLWYMEGMAMILSDQLFPYFC